MSRSGRLAVASHRSVHLALSAPTMRRRLPWWKIIKPWDGGMIERARSAFC